MIVNQLILLFGLIILGYVLNKLKILDSISNEKISKLLVNVAIPATIIHSASGKESNDSDKVLIFFVIAIVYYLVVPFISKLIAKLLKKEATFELMLTYSNLGFMGIPIIQSIYGDSAVFYVTIFMMIFNVSIFSQGIYTLKGKDNNGIDFKSMLNPGIISAILALIIFIFKLPIQKNIDTIITSVGSITTPLAMIVIGSSLGTVSLKEVFLDKSMYILTLLKLFVYPLIVYLVLNLIISDPIVIGICVILTSLPTAGNVSMVCSEYGGNLGLVSKGICISTLFSIVSLPLWLAIII